MSTANPFLLRRPPVFPTANPVVAPPAPQVSPAVNKGLILPFVPFAPVPQTELPNQVSDNNAGALALSFNHLMSLSAPSSTMALTGQATVGEEGSTALIGAQVNSSTVVQPPVLTADATAVAGPTTNAPMVSALSAWQMTNPTGDWIGRVALPIAAIFVYRAGHHVAAALLAAPAAVLWYNRLK